MIALFAGVLATPFLRRFHALTFPPFTDVALTSGLAVGSIVALEATLRVFDR